MSRAAVAAALEQLGDHGGVLSAAGSRATSSDPANFRAGLLTPTRLRLWQQLGPEYLALQDGITRGGRAAVVTAGVPGAGKSTAVRQFTPVDDGWRRLDADVVKKMLLTHLVQAGKHDDLLQMLLPDGRTVTPAELAGLVHLESVQLLDEIRSICMRRGENVVIEGTLTWPPYGHGILDDLLRYDYREVTILDVEVPQYVAEDQALDRWWTGRQDYHHGRSPQGGRFVPASVIAAAYTDPVTGRSVCSTNARAVFDSRVGHALDSFTLTVLDRTGGSDVVETFQRQSGRILATPVTPAITPANPAGAWPVTNVEEDQVDRVTKPEPEKLA